MSREALQTVTLPILVVEGVLPEGAFGSGGQLTNVRTVLPNEIRRESSAFTGMDNALFSGLGLLKSAYEIGDELGLEDALHLLRPHLPLLKGSVVTEDPEKKWDRARFDYTTLMNPRIQLARLVTWWTPRKRRSLFLSPAIFCPDLKTAAFVMQHLNGLRVCPKCKLPFVPRADNVRFCSPAHGVAHRTAKSRRQAKRRATGYPAPPTRILSYR